MNFDEEYTNWKKHYFLKETVYMMYIIKHESFKKMKLDKKFILY
jgi:hypothetical protein